jgi:hypothetical protein
MNRPPIAIYLHDHLAGAAYALDLVEAPQENYQGAALGDFAAELRSAISADKDVLQGIAFKPVTSLLVCPDRVGILRIRLRGSQPHPAG